MMASPRVAPAQTGAAAGQRAYGMPPGLPSVSPLCCASSAASPDHDAARAVPPTPMTCRSARLAPPKKASALLPGTSCARPRNRVLTRQEGEERRVGGYAAAGRQGLLRTLRGSVMREPAFDPIVELDWAKRRHAVVT